MYSRKSLQFVLKYGNLNRLDPLVQKSSWRIFPFWPKSDRILVLSPYHPQPIAQNLGVREITFVVHQLSKTLFLCV